MIRFTTSAGACTPSRGNSCLWLALAMLLARFAPAAGLPQEWMTPAEIDKFREEQALAKRTSMYMSAAKLRIEKAEERLAGKNAPEGDPLEFSSVADLVLGCRSALHATMINIQDQVTYKKSESAEIIKALKELKGTAEDLLPKLEKIQQQALEKRDEGLYRAVKECAQYADSAARGAKTAIEKMKQAERPGPTLNVGGGEKGGHFGGLMAPLIAKHFRPASGVKAARKCAVCLALTPLDTAGT